MPKKRALFVIFVLAAAAILFGLADRVAFTSHTNVESPLLIGWGGITLLESEKYDTTTPSIVFPDQTASNAEMVMRKLQDSGYNAVRLYFKSPVTQKQEAKTEWNEARFDKSLTIAKSLGLWVIVDFHAYCDWLYVSSRIPYACKNPSYDGGSFQNQNLKDGWIAWWRDNIINKYKNAYDKLIWQPMNEPIVSDATGKWPADASILQVPYQDWIDMARAQGDAHWIIVSNSNWDGDWPNVNDPLDKIFLDRHWYFFYLNYINSGEGYFKWDYDANGNYFYSKVSCGSLGGWTEACGRAYADSLFSFVKKAENKHHRNVLTQETGAFDAEYQSGMPLPPDHIDAAQCSYSPVTLAFLQRLVNNFDSSPRRNYILWTAGDWTPLGLYGCLNNWGSELTFRPALDLPPPPPGSTLAYTLEWDGYDYDIKEEVNVTLNGQLVALLPTTWAPENNDAWTKFSLDITNYVSETNTLIFSQTGSAGSSMIRNLVVRNSNGSIPFSDATERAIWQTGNPSTTYTFAIGSTTFTLQWENYDAELANEVSVLLNDQLILTYPSADVPANNDAWISMSMDVTKYVVSGTNTLIFRENGGSGQVRNVVVVDSNGNVIFSDSTARSFWTPDNTDITHTFTR